MVPSATGSGSSNSRLRFVEQGPSHMFFAAVSCSRKPSLSQSRKPVPLTSAAKPVSSPAGLRCAVSTRTFGPSSGGLRPLAFSVNWRVSTWNGLAKPTVAIMGRLTVLGSRHESEQTPPHPNSKVLVYRYAPSRLVRSEEHTSELQSPMY